MKSEILKLLREEDSHVSGQELCEKLGVSRTAIWKAIKQLKEEGYCIEAVQNKGYQLLESPDSIHASEIESQLSTQWLGKPILYKKEVDSTNTWAKHLAQEDAKQGTVVIAEQQSKGKGRRGRTWESEEGTAIAMSMVLKPNIRPEQAPMLTIVMGLSAAQAIEELLDLEPMIKWPNDVVIAGKKVCGILTEMSAQMTCIDYVICGIGINVNNQTFPEELVDSATSLALQCGKVVRRAPLLACMLQKIEANYEKFLETKNLSPLLEEYHRLLINKGKKVRVLEPEHEYIATSHGINEKGELLVVREDGTQTAIFAGEVSVRGMYGYVE